MVDKAKTGLDLLREPFSPNQVSKLPKPTQAQTDAVKADFRKGIRCQLCGAWHHPDVVHLDYVGHAALTDRLLDADPEWSWEPLATRDGLPAFDQTGGLWIKLTVCGVTRLGYGHAASKPKQDPGAREKEVIGDALRNAGMRFGAALDLWHKGDLHGDGDGEAEGDDSRTATTEGTPEPTAKPASAPVKSAPKADSRETYSRLSAANRKLADLDSYDQFWANAKVINAFKTLPADWRRSLTTERDEKRAELVAAKNAPPADDFPRDLPITTGDDFPGDMGGASVTQRIVEDDHSRKLLIAFIERQPLPFTVSIQTGGRRSIAQNRLNRLWMGEIAEQLPGTFESPEHARGYCKLHHGVPILREADEVFRDHYDRVLRPLPYATKLACMMVPIDLPVTSRMNTRQLTRYLDEVHRDFSGQGVVLTIPPDKSGGWQPAPPIEAYEGAGT